MTQIIDAAQRVKILLRTFDEARVAWDTRSSGGGALLMPTLWHEGSYQELERCLVLMRDGGEDVLLDPKTGRGELCRGGFMVTTLRPPERRLWWHLSQRYRWGELRTITCALRKTRLGPELVLPERCELVAGGAVVGERQAIARVYTWSESVDDGLAEQGVRLLVSRMFSGMQQRIQIPLTILRRELGLPVGEPDMAEDAVAA